MGLRLSILHETPCFLGRKSAKDQMPELSQTEGSDLNVEQEIRELASKFASTLKERIDNRVREMEDDDKSHFLIYQVLGITDEEGHLIDMY